jgi:putative phage-type endonuclease
MTAAVAIPVRQNSPEWLAARRESIGSSDIPIIVGESAVKSAYTLAAEKLGLAEPKVDADRQELFDIGHLLEPGLLAIYERKTGRHPKARHGMFRHPTIAWATASLDGTAPVRRIVEAKWSNAAKWRSGERIPGDVQAQVQWQLFVMGWDVADVVALEHGLPRVEVVERDDEMIEDQLELARDFHEMLLRGELPDADGSDSTAQTIRRLHPRDDGTVLPATADLAEMVARFREAKAAVKAASDEEGSIGNALRLLIGEASEIAGLVSYRRNADSTRVNWPAVAKAYRERLEEVVIRADMEPDDKRVALEELDAIQSIYSEIVQGPRVLRLLSKGAAA